MVRCGIAAFLGDVERVLKADKGEEGEHRALHQDEPFALIDGGRRHLQQVDAAPVRETNGNDEDQPCRLDQSAQHVDPHGFANAAEHDAGEHEQKAEREPPERDALQD